jgi:hypothetical protein
MVIDPGDTREPSELRMDVPVVSGRPCQCRRVAPGTDVRGTSHKFAHEMLPSARRARLDALSRPCWRASWIAGVAKPEIPYRLCCVDLARRSAEKEAEQAEMPAGPSVTGLA